MGTINKYDLAVKGGTYLTFDDNGSIVSNGLMLLKAGRIKFIGSEKDFAGEYRADKTINGSGKYILPAFFNQHTHLSLSLYRGLGADLKLHDWLNQVIWPLEDAFCQPDNVYLGSALSLVEMIKNGTGTVANMDFHSLAVGKAAEESGLRVILGEGLFDDKTPSAVNPSETFDYTLDLLNKYAGNPLISVYLTPHAPFSCSGDLYAMCGELGRKWKVPVCSHLSETREEIRLINEEYGLSPVEYLERTGVFDHHFIAIHGVHLSDDDIEIMRERKVAVIHNPHSNMILGSGFSPVKSMLSAGIKVGIGTDSAASNNHLSMLRELQTAYLIHKGLNHDPAQLPAYKAIEMAVRTGFEIYGMKDLGTLKNDNHADFIVMDLEGIHNQPSPDPYSAIVSSSHPGDITSLVVNGKVIMEDRRILTLDEEILKKEAAKFGRLVKNSFPDI